MSDVAIQKALEIHLSGFQSQNVAWENIEFNPVDGTSYLRPVFMPSEPSQASLGTSGLNRKIGIFQVSVVHPLMDGSGPAAAKADAIVNHFKRGTTLTQDGLNIRIAKAWRGPGLTQGKWYTIPVSVSWYAYATN